MQRVSGSGKVPAGAAQAGLMPVAPTPEQRRESRASWTQLDVVSTLVVFASIAVAYVYFSG